MPNSDDDSGDEVDRRALQEPYKPIYGIFRAKPVLIKQRNDYEGPVLAKTPILGALLFDNVTSDARDHCANERTFLSWLRLSTYMTIVAVAVVLSFHLKSQPTKTELKLALPFGLVFWLLSVASLGSGIVTYCRTVVRYSKRTALVQSGWKTELVMISVAITIVAACILFLTTNAKQR